MDECSRPLLAIVLLGTAQELVWIAVYALGPLREHTGYFLALVSLSFALCLWSFFRLPLKSRPAILCVLGFALLFRCTLLGALPSQSEDVYRYLWDARVSSMGIDPFRYPPDAPELEAVRDSAVYPLLNSKPYVTAYPPLSQALFRACYALFPENVVAMKSLFSLFEFASLVIAWRLLVAFGWNLRPLYLVAWNPFFIFEFSHSGHSDSGMIFFLLLSVYLLHRLRTVWAMASYAGAVMVKLHPALWFPLYLRRAGWKSAAALIVAAALMLAYFRPVTLLEYLRSLRYYFRLFEFNASIHYLLRFIGRSLFDQSWDQVTGPYLGVCLALVAALIWWKFPARNAMDMLHAGFWIMTADLCLATTVHPWYLSWAALALPFFPYAFMVYWTGACFLSYIAYQYRPVFEPAWALLAEYLPMYVLMAWEIRHGGPVLPGGAGGKEM